MYTLSLFVLFIFLLHDNIAYPFYTFPPSITWQKLSSSGSTPYTPISLNLHHCQGLTFTWSCSFDAEACATADGPPLRLLSSPSIAIPSGSLLPSAPGRPYRFTVSVSKPGRVPAFTSATVHVRAAALPEASVAALASATAFQSDGSVRCCQIHPMHPNCCMKLDQYQKERAPPFLMERF